MGTRTTRAPRDHCPADDTAVEPPYREHPTAASVHGRARERARRAVDAAQHANPLASRWGLTPGELDALADLAVQAAWHEFAVAAAMWEDNPAAPVPAAEPVAARPARRRTSSPRPRTTAA